MYVRSTEAENGGWTLETPHWDDKIGYLEKTRGLLFNSDYWSYLVGHVWRLGGRPIEVVDFGCGYGDVGLKLLPLLAEGSRYIGIDKGPLLIEKARERFGGLPYRSEFQLADLDELQGQSEADVAICQAVLLHMPEPLNVLRTMMSFVKPGGLVICIEPHWNSSMANLYYEGLEPTNTFALGILQKLYHLDKIRTGKDGNIGIKLPVYMSGIGLVRVECRVSDRVNYLHSRLPDGERADLYASLSEDGLGRVVADKELYVSGLVERGLTLKEAEQLYRSEKSMTEYFRVQGVSLSALFAPTMMITYGTVPESRG